MNYKINLKKQHGWKKHQIAENDFFYKGYLNNKKFLNVFQYILKNSNDKKKMKNFLFKLDGLFAIALTNKKSIFLITDRINSTPFIYKLNFKKTTISVSDHYLGLNLSNNEDLTVDQFQSKHFAMTGYTFLNGTIYKEVKKTSTGNFINIKNNKIDINKYYSWEPYKKKRKERISEVKINIRNLNLKIIDKLLSTIDNRTIVIPLSAGFDSRFILSGLIHRGYKNIISFSYGRNLNREMTIAKEIAKKLNVPWYPIIYNNLIVRESFNTQKYINFLQYSDNLSALYFMQDFLALEYLQRKRLIPKNSIIVNGQTGDFISGNHLINSNKNKKNEDSIKNFINKHYKNWHKLKIENFSLIKSVLEKEFNTLGIKNNTSNKLEFLEFIEFENRQSKYIMNGQRTYDFLGYSWRLPLWDKDYLDFWEKLDIKYKKNQWLYKETLIEQNWGNVWQDIEINPRPDSMYSKNIKIIRFFFKAIFFPFGQEHWHSFEKKFFDYFLSNLCSYAPFKYINIIKDKRGFSSPISWHVESYLNKKNLDWKGNPDDKK